MAISPKYDFVSACGDHREDTQMNNFLHEMFFSRGLFREVHFRWSDWKLVCRGGGV